MYTVYYITIEHKPSIYKVLIKYQCQILNYKLHRNYIKLRV